MHTEQIPSPQESSTRDAVECTAMARARRAPAFRRPSVQVRAVAAVAAVLVSATTLGTVLALYGEPDSAVLIARAAAPVDDFDPLDPGSSIPTLPCVPTKPWRCA